MRIQTEAGHSSWGRVIRRDHELVRPRFTDEVVAWAQTSARPRLAIGMGRSYGDTALSADAVLIDMRGLDRICSFDPHTRILCAEAGLSLDALMRQMAPRGFFPKTCPGTRYVTLGGAVANDVHGKNHHSAGAFGCAVRGFTLLRSDRGVIDVTPDAEPELFKATIGGLGLTGVVLNVTLELAAIPSTQLDVEIVPFADLDGFFDISADSAGFEHTVSWVDCTASGSSLGKGVFQRANWVPDGARTPHKQPGLARMPVDAPSFALNPLTLKTFNALYYAAQTAKPQRSRSHYGAVLHPLDSIHDWNRLYGANGFYQYQCAVPPDAREALRDMLRVIARSGEGSFLAVLKSFGPKPSPGLLSFPIEGYTLALDFRNRSGHTARLLGELDAIVRDARGRLYPAKDGRLPAAMMRAGFPQLDRFDTSIDPMCRSDFWTRISS